MAGDEAVLQAVELQPLPGNAGRVQGRHLLDQPLLEALTQPGGDAPAQLGALSAQAEDQRMQLRQGGEAVRGGGLRNNFV